jgi:hypothetical protein
MAAGLSDQYRAFKSRRNNYAVYSFPNASRISERDRRPLMEAMNGIIAVNWAATEPHWTDASSPFDRKYCLILVYDGSVLIAFSVYRMLQLSAGPAIYRSGTEVLPAHQGRGLYRMFTNEIFKSTGAAYNGGVGILYGWRTRNPIVWAANARICGRIAPALLGGFEDPSLQTACIEMCLQIYPDKRLEVPGMVMRGVYGHIRHHRQAYYGEVSQVDAAMSRIIPDSADAFLSVGIARW